MLTTAAAPARRIGRAATAPKTASRLSIGDLRASHYAALPPTPATPIHVQRKSGGMQHPAASLLLFDIQILRTLDEARFSGVLRLRLRLRSLLLRGAPLYPQVGERVVDIARLHLRNLLHEAARRDHLIDDELRLIRRQF